MDVRHERIKEQLMHLLEQSNYDPQNKMHRSIIAYVYISALERKMHLFVTNWNNPRIGFQKELYLRRNYSKWLNYQEF